MQWAGIDYAYALRMLQEHDKSFDWRTLAKGIVIAGEQMQYLDGSSKGYLKAKEGVSYQVIVNGEHIVEVKSKGVDVIDLAQ